MKRIYIAHPYGGRASNLVRAKQWLAWLLQSFPRNRWLAQWILECEILDEPWPDVRALALALRRDCENVADCDALIGVGGEWSPGMREERGEAKMVFDLTDLGPLPPEVGNAWIRTPTHGLIAAALDGADWGRLER